MIKLLSLMILILLTGCQEKPVKIKSFTGNAMTIDYRILIGENLSLQQQQEIENIIESTFLKIDKTYNKWNPDSEISQLNQAKANQQLPISPELERFLTQVEQIVEISQGLFDPTIEPLQKIWKERLEIGKIPTDDEIASLLPAVGWNKIHFSQGSFIKDHDLTSIDLGGIAKGLAIDILVARLNAAGYAHVYAEWGGEIRAAGKHPDNRPWNIFISCLGSADPDNAIAHISLTDQAIATSGDYLQYWKIEDPSNANQTISYFHIINPKTQKPLTSTSTSVASASVIAPNCVLADGLATVAMMFPDVAEANKWAEKIKLDYPSLKFWIVSREMCKETYDQSNFFRPWQCHREF